MLYCLKIERVYADYKRAHVDCNVEHFRTIEEANERRREEKREYYESYLSMLEECNEEVPKDIDELNEEDATRYVYSTYSMDMPPFSATLYEIKIAQDSIIQTPIPFPNIPLPEEF